MFRGCRAATKSTSRDLDRRPPSPYLLPRQRPEAHDCQGSRGPHRLAVLARTRRILPRNTGILRMDSGETTTPLPPQDHWGVHHRRPDARPSVVSGSLEAGAGCGVPRSVAVGVEDAPDGGETAGLPAAQLTR